MENVSKLYELIEPLYQNIVILISDSHSQKFLIDLTKQRNPGFNCTLSVYLKKTVNMDNEIGMTLSTNCQNQSHFMHLRNNKTNDAFYLMSDIYLEKSESSEELMATNEFSFDENSSVIDSEIISATENLIEQGSQKILEFIKENS
ncbi:MAG: hypothetical protein Q8M29_19225 [Bacteroidota bacterium]|nr:hypothetical protein [Bacteroidota bacterium]